MYVCAVVIGNNYIYTQGLGTAIQFCALCIVYVSVCASIGTTIIQGLGTTTVYTVIEILCTCCAFCLCFCVCV